MKNSNHVKAIFVSVLFVLVSITASFAQAMVDKVIMLDGQTKEGKVTSVGVDSIKFVYTGEDLEYEMNRSEINKIIFASGRTEIINEIKTTASSSSTNSNATDRRNKIAVIPFEITSNDSEIMIEPMKTDVQTDCINSLRENTTSVYQIQDPMTTNALLAKNDISNDQLRIITPNEMAEILGVEYVVYGSLQIENKGTITTGSEVTSYKGKTSEKDEDSKKKNQKGTAITTNNSSTTINYDLHVKLSIYADSGNTVYSDSKRPFGSGLDSYKSSLNYLIKRTPFGTKAKR